MTLTRHPWTAAWSALSPLRRTLLWGRVVDREPVAALALRVGRREAETAALLVASLRAFRREVVLGVGTGYDEECGAVVLRLVDSAGERLDATERRALSRHAAQCPACAEAVEELLELDARLRDGLLRLEPPAGASRTTAGTRVPSPRQGSGVAAPLAARTVNNR